MIDVSGITHSDVTASTGNGQRKNMPLLTKAEACWELGISLSTLDRRIASGNIRVKREPRGRRHRVYVVMERGEKRAQREDWQDPLIRIAEERIQGLEGQVQILKEQLGVERKRNSLLLDELIKHEATSRKRRQRTPWPQFWKSRK